MKLDYSVKIGLLPVRRDVSARPGIFNWEIAEERCRVCVDYIETQLADANVSFVDLKGINPVDCLYSEKDVPAVVERFRQAGVDAVFAINGNFGNEEVVAMVVKALGKPALLWAPQDDRFDPDGMRYTDSQCGVFGIARQLQRFHLPFSYIENCRPEDAALREGFASFVRVACMVKNFGSLRIGQVGLRPKPFCSVIFNEGELMSRFGLQIVPINLAVVIDKYNRILRQRTEELAQGAALLRSRYEMDDLTPPLLEKVYAFVLLYQELFEEYNLSCVSAECWTAMQLAVGAMPCTAYSILADMGYIVSCESDLHAAITMCLLSCATLGQRVPFMGEFTVRHPEDRNIELLWHCGPFAYSLKKDNCPCRNVNMRQWFQVKDGTYTVSRLDQDDGNYSLLAGTCRSATGPYTFGTYLWARFDNLSAWERTLIRGPYIHHMVEIAGDVTRELREFSRYVPGIRPDAPED